MPATATAPEDTTVIDERVELTFACRQGSTTKWIEIGFPIDAEPTALLADLADAGFAHDGMRAVEFDGQKEIVLVSRGTGLFAGWTKDEETSKMRAARAALRKHGFTKVLVWRKTLADML